MRVVGHGSGAHGDAMSKWWTAAVASGWTDDEDARVSKEPDFSRFFTLYWPGALAFLRESELRPLTVLGVGRTPQLRLSQHGAREGDVVVPITVEAGAVFVLGAMELGGPAEGEPLRSLGPVRVGGKQLVAVRLDRFLSPAELRGWLVNSSRGFRQPDLSSEGKVWRLGGFDGIRHLHPRTAQLVWEVLHRAPPEIRRGPSLEQLEQLVRGQPWARERAAVLADALSEGGDPRGRVMAIELAIAAEADPARAASLDAELHELLERSPQLHQRPGGFPWRERYSSRGVRRFVLAATLTRESRFAELVDLLFELPRLRLEPDDAHQLDALAAAVGGHTTPNFAVVSLSRRELDVARLFTAGGTIAFRFSVWAKLRWPGHAQALPFQRGPMTLSTLAARFPSRQLELALTLPEGLHSISALVRTWHDAFRAHGLAQVEVRQEPLSTIVGPW